MKGFRFYAERRPLQTGRLTVKRFREIADSGDFSNCIAVSTDRDSWFRGSGGVMVETIGSVFSHDDSAVTGTAASVDYIREGKRIPESLARRLHPSLFRFLDNEN